MNIEIENYLDALENNFILVVTSNSKEKDAVNKVITKKRNLIIPISTHGCNIGLLDGVFVIHLTGGTGLSTNYSAGRLVLEFVNRNDIPKPKIVYLVGFCWGTPNKTSIGDIVISSAINSLNSRTVKGGEVEYKSIQYRSTIDVEYIASEISNLIPNSRIGELASLETLLSSTSERDKLLEKNPQLIGGEMEAFAFVPSLKEIPWIIVKSVSDFGCDDFERSQQENAAISSASVLPKLSRLLINKELFSLSISKPHELSLLDSLFGDEIRVCRRDVQSDELNDHLNNEIGVIVERKLEFYLNNDGYDRSFIRYFCDLILEVLQNSLRHSGASFASVKFYPDKIVLNDDGVPYKLEDLKGNNGGASAWRRLMSYDGDLVKYSFRKKSHYFEMKATSKELAEAISNCSASIKPASIGSGYGRQVVLAYREGCEIIYLEDINVRMTSRRIILISEVKKLLDDGKKVYVKVSDKAYAEEYKAALKEHSNNLRIIIK